MTGGGKQNAPAAGRCRKYILTKVCRFIKKIIEELKRKLSDESIQNTASTGSVPKLSLASCKGVILIEFAVCMPILIILLFYINDLVKIKRYYSETEFVAQQMANMIQNISQKRTDKKITKQDLKYAASLAFLSMYPGKTIYHTDTRSSESHELSHQPEFFVYYIKGLSGGKASCIWKNYVWCNTGIDPTGWTFSGNTKTDHSQSVVRWKTEAEPSDIYSTLKINEGEVKIIVEATPWCKLVTMSTSDYNASDDQSTCARKAFRCRLVTPKVVGSANYFNSVVIFTPKPGLFDETPPS